MPRATKLRGARRAFGALAAGPPPPELRIQSPQLRCAEAPAMAPAGHAALFFRVLPRVERRLAIADDVAALVAATIQW